VEVKTARESSGTCREKQRLPAMLANEQAVASFEESVEETAAQ
jgi:hypothetical protein